MLLPSSSFHRMTKGSIDNWGKGKFLVFATIFFGGCRQILDLGKQFNLMTPLENVLKTSLQDVLRMSWRSLEDVLKMSWRLFCRFTWRRFEDVLKTSWQDALKMSWRRLEDVLKTFLQDVLKTSWKRLEDVLKTYGQDEYIGLDQDVFWRRKAKANIFVLIKTSWRRLENVFWRRRRKTNVC